MRLENQADPAPDANRESDIQTAHVEPNIPRTRGVPSFPPAHTHCEITCKAENSWWDKFKPWVEILGVVLLMVYTGFTIKIFHANNKAAAAAKDTLKEIQKQTTMIHQQLVGTMGAKVTLQEPRITPDPITNRQIVVMQLLSGQGRVESPDAHMSFQIATTSFPKMSKLYHSQSYTVTLSQFGNGWAKQYPLPDVSRQDMQFLSQRKTVTIKGRFGFDNGFGDKIPDQEFCFSYIGLYNTKNEDGGSTSGGGGFIPCDQFENTVSYILEHPLPR